MVRPGRERLTGIVEVDETYIGGREPGLRGGRAKGKKVLTGIAVEIKGMSPEPQVIDIKRPGSAPSRPRTPTATSWRLRPDTSCPTPTATSPSTR